MKALLITKPFFIEPLGLMYVSAAAKSNGHEVDLALTSSDLEKKLTDFQPGVVGYSVMTGNQDFYLNLNQELKQNHDFVSVFGGPHPTFFPQMISEKGVDIVCRGEGEQAFPELLDNLEKGENYSDIPNLTVMHSHGISQNTVRNFVDIDSLNFPDRDLVFQFDEIRDGPIKHFIASRGCPFSCSYCFNESYSELYKGKGKRVRFRNPKSLVDEVEDVVNSSPTKFVYFQDDTFTLNAEWLREFNEEYSSRINLPYHCHVRPNTVTKEKIELLRESGCYSAHIAAESGNDRLRNEILNRNMSREEIVNACGLLKQAGIKYMLQNIIGLPTGTIENDIETLALNIECKPDYAWVSIFQPYPGTPLGEFCREKGYYEGDFSDIGSNFFDASPLNFSEEYRNQLSNLQKTFAILVENPELVTLGLAETMINRPHSEVKEQYQKAYREFRKQADKRLYGFEL